MSLVCWLPLDGNLNQQGASNIEATGTNLTLNTSGKIGSCYSFNGSNSYIMLSEAPFSNSITEFSYTCWIKFTSLSSGCLFSNRTISQHTGITIFVNNSGNILFDAGNERRTKAYTFATNIWYHLAFTYKKGDKKKIYINGTEIDSITSTGSTTAASATNAFIGASQNSSTTVNANYLNGQLNDIRIYNHCLSAAEVHEISQGLVLHYKLDDTIGFTDLIARGTTWTIYNNHNNTNMPSTLVDTGNMYNGDKVYRETCTPTDNSINSIRTSLGSHGIYNWRRTFTANTKYVFWIYYKPISHSDTRCGGTASNIGGWTEIPPVEVGGGWYRVGAYRNGTVTTDKTDNIFVSFKVPSATVGDPIIIDWASPHLLQGITEIPSYDYPSTIIQDSSGYGHNGSITGTITLDSNTPRYSASSTFNGTERIVATTPGADIRTLSCWCKTTKNKSTSQHMMADSFSNMCISFYNGTIIGVFGTTRGTGSKSTLGTSYKENDWNHIVVVKTDDAGARDIYCNGVKLTPTSNDYWSAASGFFIGARNNTNGNAFYGNISDVRAYCTALSAADVKQLYEVGAKVDNKHCLHTYEYLENNKNKITKQGQIQASQISEFSGLSFLKYDPNTYIEPDGSVWIRIYHHNNPGGGSFSSSNDFVHSVYIDENRWFNVEICNYLDKWEFMVKGKFTSTSEEWKLRWVQNVNPMTAAFADVAAAKVTKITTDGYSTYPSSWGGLYAKKSSAYLTTNNGNSGNWWGAVGSYSVYQSGIPGWGPTGTVTTTGFNDLYVRIDNITLSNLTVKTTKNNIWTANNLIEF